MKLELMTVEIICRICVSKTMSALNGNLQTIKHLHNNIPSSKVGIPMFKLQVTLLISVK
jgi:hypothetical protein